MPVDSLVAAVLPRLFRASSDGQAKHPALLARLVAATVGYGLAAGTAVWWGAGLLPLVLGMDFAPAVPALQVMALYVPAYCLRSLGATVLLGAGRLRWRLACEATAIVALATLLTLVVPSRGAEGAAWALVASETGLALLLWWGIAGGRSRIVTGR